MISEALVTGIMPTTKRETMSVPVRNDLVATETRPDSEFALRARSGDRDAFEELVRRHEVPAYRLALRILKSREDAEDAVQEAFVRAWRGLAGFDAAREFRPWVMRIATNVALTHAGRTRRAMIDDVELDDLEVADPRSLSPARVAAVRETATALESIVQTLPAESAAIFHLRYVEEQSMDEIAQAIGKQPGTVAVALHRLREKLRTALYGPEEATKP